MNIVLIGGRGAGKTGISSQLFNFLKLPIFQLDSLIVYEENGLSIPEIVEKHGWHYFRDVEYRVVYKASKMKNVIIDCGGGVVVDIDENGNEFFSERKVNALKSTGKIFFLNNDIEILEKRITGDNNRPDLSKILSFREIIERRIPFYQKAADYEIYLKNISCKKAAKKIIKISNYSDLVKYNHRLII